MRDKNEKMKTSHLKIWISGIIGLVIGFLLCGVIIFAAMPSLMIVTAESKLGFDGTVATLEKRVPELGWVVSGDKSLDMNKSIAKHGENEITWLGPTDLLKQEQFK